MTSAGTQGWTTFAPLSKRRFGIPGPHLDDPLKDSPEYWAIKSRTAGQHLGYTSLLQWLDDRGSWMLLVLDDDANIVGQVFARVQSRCNEKMNEVFEAKGLGVYSGASDRTEA